MFDLFGFGFKSDIEEAEEQTRSFREYLHREEIRILAEKIQRLEGRLEKIAPKEPCKHEPDGDHKVEYSGPSISNFEVMRMIRELNQFKCKHCGVQIRAVGWEAL